MAHQPRPAISSQLVGVVAEKACNLGLHSVRQQRSRAIAQNLCQRIAESPSLGELDHIILGHGVSLLWWRSGGFEHPHDTPPYPFTPSPTFAHSSSRSGGLLSRPSPRRKLPPKKKMLSGFEFVSGLADGASGMPA
jgi:hypothetical protein